jgi:release factor glutamine methyltransferase
MRRTLFKAIFNVIIRPVARRYLSVERKYRWKDINIKIPAGVFHPGLFYSTKLLLKLLESMNVAEKSFLELGAGSGIISICAAKKKAYVTASDISVLAVKATEQNAQLNKVNVQVIQSDLFDKIEGAPFDIIFINPPYYKGNPAKEADYAWKAGEHLEYFERLFQDVGGYIKPDTEIIMVLSEDAAIDEINSIAVKNHFHLTEQLQKYIMLEKHFIFSIKQGSATIPTFLNLSRLTNTDK